VAGFAILRDQLAPGLAVAGRGAHAITLRFAVGRMPSRP
jgi:hypothetical protein